MSQPKPKVFISGSSAHAGELERLASALQQKGVETSLAATLQPSDDFAKGIDAAIMTADGIVFLIEAKSSESRWVEYEWMTALETSWLHPEKRLIAVVVDEATPPAFLHAFKWIRVPAGPSEDNWTAVADDVVRTLRDDAGSGANDARREKAYLEWRKRLSEIGDAVKPLAEAERQRK